MERHLAPRRLGEVIHISTVVHKRKRSKKKSSTTTTSYASDPDVGNIQDRKELREGDSDPAAQRGFVVLVVVVVVESQGLTRSFA